MGKLKMKKENKLKNILIIGGTGFLGFSFVHYFSLNSDLKVYATYHKRKPIKIKGVHWIKIDLLEKVKVNKLFQKKFDFVINAAASTSGSNMIHNQPKLHVSPNAIMNINIVDAMCENINPGTYIFLSCSVMYANSQKSHSESTPILLENIHDKYQGVASMKLFVEQLNKFYSKFMNTNFIVVRHSNIYGPYDKFNLETGHVLASLMMKAADSKSMLKVWGDGSEKRDFLFISDFICAIEKMIYQKKSKFQLYNIGSGTFTSIYDLAHLITKVVNPNLRIIFTPDPRQIKTSIKLNVDKAKRNLIWKPKVKLEDGLRDTFLWYKKNQTD